LPDLTSAAVGQTAFVFARAEKCLFGTDKQFRGVDKPFEGTLGQFGCFDDDGVDRTYAAVTFDLSDGKLLDRRCMER